MSKIFDAIYTLWNQIIYAILNISVFDFLDIILITYIVYKSIQFLRESRGGQLVKGLIILFGAYAISIWFNLAAVRWVLTNVMDWGIIALAIIFQPELRRALERIGRSKIGQFAHMGNQDEEYIKSSVDSVCMAVQNMHDQRIGALIVFERQTSLGEIANTGTLINADTSSQIIGNIFYPKSPLHDGALIMREGKVLAAGCILPLTNNQNLSAQLGTRHRAAIGMSEVSDAIVIVVSEETGKISLVQNGTIERGYDQIRLREELYRLLLSNEADEKSGSIVDKAKTFIGNHVKKAKKKDKGETQ